MLFSPIHWQHGGLARLKKDETINDLLEGGYSTISLGYIGLYELTQIVMGCSHTTEEGKKFALSVVKYMKEKCNQWNEEKNLGFGLYGTPAETLCYRSWHFVSKGRKPVRLTMAEQCS